MNDTLPKPYIGPRTFTEKEGDRFFGRESEARDLLALVVSERLVVFYAQSGAGKSSLVNARLIHELRNRGYEIFTGRVVGDPPGGIKPENIFVFNLLRSLALTEKNAAALATRTISEFIQGQLHEHGSEEDPESAVLIIDQFEELFSTHHEEWEKREGFFKQLAEALEGNPYLSILLVMREDYVASLDPYSPLVPSRFRRRYYMQRLERDAALEAIKEPVAKIRPFEDGVAEKLVNDLSGIKIQKADETTETQPGQFVEAVQLQLICYKLWKGLAPGDHITHADLDKLGDVDIALEEHYAERVREVAEQKKVSERLIREWFGKKLITPAGTRNLVLRTMRRVEGELPDNVIQALQSDLVRAEQRGASTFYELTHDRLVEPILANNKKWFDNLSPLQRQASLWNDQGRSETWLFGDQALAEAEVWAKEHQSELTHIEREFLRISQKNQKEKVQRLQARQQRIIVYLSIVAILVTSGLGMFGIFQANDAKENALTAQAASTLAYTIAETSQANALIAQANEAEAKKQSSISRAGELAAQSQRLLTTNLQNALLLAVEAFNMENTLQSRSALLDAAVASPQVFQFLPPGHMETVTTVAFSPDGKILASGSADDNILLWDMETSQRIGQLTGHGSDVTSLAFSPDGNFLASGSADAAIILWDVENRQRIDQLKEHTSYVSSVAFSPDGKILASGSHDNYIILWDVESRLPIYPPIEQSSYVSTVAFSQDGSILASAGGGTAISLWNVKTGESIGQLLSDNSSSFSSIAFSPDGTLLASANYDYATNFEYTVNLWDLNSLELIGPLEGSASYINSIAFTPDGGILAAGSYDNSILLWDVNFFESIGKLAGTTGFVSVDFSPDGRVLASGSYDNNITLWAIDRSNPISQLLPADTDYVTSVAVSPDSKILASGGDNDNILLWDMVKQQSIGRLTGHTGDISAIAFSPNGKLLASGSFDYTIILWNVEARRQIAQLEAHENTVTDVAFSPDGKILATSSYDGTIILWDVETGLSIGKPLVGNLNPVFSIAFSPDGLTLFSSGCGEIPDDSGCIAGDITEWDVMKQQPIAHLAGHTSEVTSLAFSPDGKILASGSYDNTIILWDVETRRPIGQLLTGQYSSVNSVSFSPDGNILASGTYDNIILWDVETRQPIGQPLIGNAVYVVSVVFLPDSNLLASGDGSSIFLWDIDPESWQQQACQRAGRNFNQIEWERYFPGDAYRETCEQWSSEIELTATGIAAETQVSPATSVVTQLVSSVTVTATPPSFSPTATATPVAGTATATRIPSSTATSTATFSVKKIVANLSSDVDRLNLRAGPGTIYDVILLIPEGAIVEVTGEGVLVNNSLWVPVLYDGTAGWVNSSYLADPP